MVRGVGGSCKRGSAGCRGRAATPTIGGASTQAWVDVRDGEVLDAQFDPGEGVGREDDAKGSADGHPKEEQHLFANDLVQQAPPSSSAREVHRQNIQPERER